MTHWNDIKSNIISKCDSSSDELQSSDAEFVNVVWGEDEIILQIRQLMSMLPANNEETSEEVETMDDLNRACNTIANCVDDTSIALSELSDDNLFLEVKENYAKDMVTGFIQLNGMTVGAIANRS